MADDKKEEERSLTPRESRMSDPFAEMRRMLDSFRMNMDDMFGRMFPSQGGMAALRQPRVDILDLGNALQVVADMPGVQKDDIEINLTPDHLEIAAESKTETERTEEEYTYRERGYSSYRRVLDLPTEVLPDRAEAKFTNGVLEVTMPKKEPTQVEQKKRVPVK